MRFNFDENIDRRNTNSIKYDFMSERGKAEDLIPLWVADMDFIIPYIPKNTRYGKREILLGMINMDSADVAM